MAESFDTSSTQASILYNTSATAEAGTTLAIKDAAGNIVLSWDVPCSFSSALISCPEMEVGGTYTVVVGDSAEEIELSEVSASYGNGQSGMQGGGQTPLDMSGSGETGGGGQAPPDMGESQEGMTGVPSMQDQGQQEQSQAEEDLAAQDTVTAQPVDAKSLAIIGGSTVLLVAAAAVVLLYKRS